MPNRHLETTAATLLTSWTDSDTAMQIVGTSLGLFGPGLLDPTAVLAHETPLRNALFDVLLSLVEGGALDLRPTEDAGYAFRFRTDFATAALTPDSSRAIDIDAPSPYLAELIQVRRERDEALGRADFAEALAAERERLLRLGDAPRTKRPIRRTRVAAPPSVLPEAPEEIDLVALEEEARAAEVAEPAAVAASAAVVGAPAEPKPVAEALVHEPEPEPEPEPEREPEPAVAAVVEPDPEPEPEPESEPVPVPVAPEPPKLVSPTDTIAGLPPEPVIVAVPGPVALAEPALETEPAAAPAPTKAPAKKAATPKNASAKTTPKKAAAPKKRVAKKPAAKKPEQVAEPAPEPAPEPIVAEAPEPEPPRDVAPAIEMEALTITEVVYLTPPAPVDDAADDAASADDASTRRAKWSGYTLDKPRAHLSSVERLADDG